MKLLLLAVLLTVVQTGPPVPRQTSDSSASAGQEHNSQADSKQKPADTPPKVTSKEQPITADGNRDKQTSKNANDPIRVSELPAVTVNNRKDWADWGAWFFTLLLAVTSALQVWLLCRTLIFARRQTHEMKRQRSYMRLQWVQMTEAGKQTERIIAQMRDTTDKELRAYVGVSKVFLNLTNPRIPVGSVEIQNFGQTPAYRVRQWVGIAPFPYPLPQPLPQSTLTQASIAVIHPGIKYSSIVPQKKPFPPGTIIGTLDLTIYVYGEVIYEDAFGTERRTSFRFIYGGPEGATQPVRSADGKSLLGFMNPDTSGNEAN